jgi:hypothetical protein
MRLEKEHAPGDKPEATGPTTKANASGDEKEADTNSGMPFMKRTGQCAWRMTVCDPLP